MKIFTYLEIGLWSFLGIAATLSLITNILLLDIFCISCIITLIFFKIIIYVTDLPVEKVSIEETSCTLSTMTNNVSHSTICTEVLDLYFEDFQKVINHLKSSQDYLSLAYSLTDLEADVSLPKKRISEVIRFNTGGNFYRLVAKLRINHAKMLIDSKLPYSFEYLSLEVGFASRSSFNKYFKDFEGITPKEYKFKIN